MKGTVAIPYDDAQQQHEAATFGMWIFLATEVLFFGGLFAAYTIYRLIYPEVFAAANARLNLWAGGINTAVLLTSSFTMASAIHSIAVGKTRHTRLLLMATIALGVAFLGIKAYEYHHDWAEHLIPWLDFSFRQAPVEQAKIFFYLYFFMTGLHAIHLTIGLFIVGYMALKVQRFSSEYYNPVEMTGLYWHFVDIVWVFLYPLLYLLRT